MNSAFLSQEAEIPSPLVTSQPESKHKKTVLLVEDESFLREITCNVLESAGFRVRKARDAKEAMAVFRKHRKAVDLLLSDVVLPGGNGYNLAQEMRTIGPKLPVVLTSGHMWNEVEKNELGKKGMFYLPKPFSAIDLVSSVRQLLCGGEFHI